MEPPDVVGRARSLLSSLSPADRRVLAEYIRWLVIEWLPQNQPLADRLAKVPGDRFWIGYAAGHRLTLRAFPGLINTATDEIDRLLDELHFE